MDKKILVASIGAVAVVAAAFIGYLSAIKPVEKEIEATQTAEAKMSAIALLPTSTIKPPQTPIPTETLTPAITQTLTPTPLVIVDTGSLIGWIPDFDSSHGDNTINDINLAEDAIELTYDVGKDGYVIITKDIKPGILLETEGIRFLYKGRGAPNAIEFKLMLRYPGDSGDTAYGILWNRATETNNKWVEMIVPYSDMLCWWPDDYCI